MFPLEMAGNSDPVKYRKLYGKNVLLMGGIDKIELAKGKTEIENEVKEYLM